MRRKATLSSPLAEALAAQRRGQEMARQASSGCLVAAATLLGVVDACVDDATALAIIRCAVPLLADAARLAEARDQERAWLDTYATRNTHDTE